MIAISFNSSGWLIALHLFILKLEIREIEH